MKTKLLCVPLGPLEVVHQRPGVVALYTDTITHSFQNLIDVMFVIVNPIQRKKHMEISDVELTFVNHPVRVARQEIGWILTEKCE